MGSVEFKTIWFLLPAFDDVLIWREPFKSFEAFGEVIGIQEVVEMLS
jgi:hypothetical protein